MVTAKVSLEGLSLLLLWSKSSTARVSFVHGHLVRWLWKLKDRSRFLMLQQMLQL